MGEMDSSSALSGTFLDEVPLAPLQEASFGVCSRGWPGSIQTLAEMTPGMVLDLEVQEVLGDGSVLFSEGPVPGLVLRASKYHRAGECISLAHHGL